MIRILLFLLGLSMFPNLAQAQGTTLVYEGFEGSCAEIKARWDEWSLGYNNWPCGDPMFLETDPARVRTGSQSLRVRYPGGTAEGGNATKHFAQITKDIWVTYDVMFSNPFWTGGDEAHGVGGVGTKGLYLYAYSPSRPGSRWGWVPNWLWGSKEHVLGTQGCLVNPQDPAYGSAWYYQNVQRVLQPGDTWVRYEVHYVFNDPGQSNGLLEQYVTVGNGPRTLTTRHTGRQCVDAVLNGMMPYDVRWGTVQIFRQFGDGTAWFDNLWVTTQPIGSGGTPPPPPPPPPSDTTAPTVPGTPSCTPSETSAACTWTASTDTNSPITYSLQYRIGSNTFVTGATSTTNSASLNGLSLNTNYDARVIATDPTGNPSAASGTGTFSTTIGGGGGPGGGGGTGTVVLDAVGASAYDATLRSSRSWTHVVNSEANRLLLVCLTAQDNRSENDAAAASVTFNGAAMTFIRKDAQLAGGRFIRTELWRLIGPPSGTGTVLATWNTTPNDYAVGRSLSLYGALASAPINANNGATGFGTTASVAVTSSVDNALMVDCALGRHQSGLTVGSSQTARSTQVIPPISDTGGSAGMSTAVKAVAGAETMDWTTTSNYWAISSVAVAPEPTAPTEPPTITGYTLDATGGNLTFGLVTPTEIRIITGNNDKGTVTSQIYPIASFPGGRFTEIWRDGLTYTCAYPIDASGVQNPSPTAHRCGSLVSIVGALDTNPPVISSCQPTAAIPHGTTSWVWSCSISKPATAKWDTSNDAYADLANDATVAGLTISGTVTGLTNGSSTPIYVGAASTDALGDEHATVANTTVTIEVAAAPQADTTRPSDVADLTVTNLGQVAELVWSPATDNVAVAGYKIYQSTGACTDYTVAGNPVTETSVQVNLAAATVHCWKATAIDGSNNESLNFSNVATMTTSGIIDFEWPSDMANLRVDLRYSTSVVLRWDTGTDNFGTPKSLIEQCQVVSGTYCENFESAKSEIADHTLRVTLTPSTTYCWRGKHYDNAGNVSRLYSNAVCGSTTTLGTLSGPGILVPSGRILGGGALSTGRLPKAQP